MDELTILRRGVIKESLKKIPIIAGFRFATVVVMSLSWLALANHCELAAATAPKPEQTHSCCEKHDAGHKAPLNHNQDKGIECCKAAHPAISPIAKNVTGQDLSFSAHSYFIGPFVFPEASFSPNILELDTGPPFAGSFAEVVLQRSILAHAPPYLI